RGRRSPGPALFPYTTLFRSRAARTFAGDATDHLRVLRRHRQRGRAGRDAEVVVAQLEADVAGDVALAQQVVGELLAQVREARRRSEEHTSELQSLAYLVCRL